MDERAVHELAFDQRDFARLALVDAVYDEGAIQLVDVTVGQGVTHTRVPVHSIAGFSSVPRAQGVVLLICVGGDPANMRALPQMDTWRFGGLSAGDVVVYAADGQRMELHCDGAINIIGSGAVTITAPGTCTIEGDVRVVGNVMASGDITDRLSSMEAIRETYDSHTHGGSAGPEPQMPE